MSEEVAVDDTGGLFLRKSIVMGENASSRFRCFAGKDGKEPNQSHGRIEFGGGCLAKMSAGLR